MASASERNGLTSAGDAPTGASSANYVDDDEADDKKKVASQQLELDARTWWTWPLTSWRRFFLVRPLIFLLGGWSPSWFPGILVH